MRQEKTIPSWAQFGIPASHIEPEQLLVAFFSSSHVGLAIRDAQLRYELVNDALAAMNRIPSEAHIGKTVRELFGSAVAEHIECALQKVLLTGEPMLDVQFSTTLPTRKEVSQWSSNYFPIKGDRGEVKQIGEIVTDITRHKRFEEWLRGLTSKLRQETARLQVLLQISTILGSSHDLQQSFSEISACIRKVIGQDWTNISVLDQSSHSMRMHALDFPLGPGLIAVGETIPLLGTASGRAVLERRPTIFNKNDLLAMQSGFINKFLQHGIQSACCIPLVTPRGTIGSLNLASTREMGFLRDDLDFLKQVAALIANALDNIQAYCEIATLKDKLAKDKLYLEEQVRTELQLDEIIGESASLKNVLRQARTVAPCDATTLILGETGTGKELIARAIHRLSLRNQGNFVKLNCAAIPTGLLESELFGHEKGSFTGAISRKIGRLELADGGTLFLDEIGDLPRELQPKLLRVLQDQEFERLGSTRTLRVNTRLIAATNRDLAKAVAAREFRSDLYYRLNVFPIQMPALRERRDDIPLLVRHFVDKFGRRMKKRIDNIPTHVMSALVSWDWPGNIRELENFIERSVILTERNTLRVPLDELAPVCDNPNKDLTLAGFERQHILDVLRDTRGVISGLHGAARLLGLKRTTLQSKMQKLNIDRREYLS